MMTRALALAGLLIACLSFAAPAAAQPAAPSPEDKSIMRDGSLYSRLLDIPPFTIGEVKRSRPAALPALYVSFIALESYDGYSTSRGLAQGAVEGNPLVRWAVEHPTTLWAVKGAAATGSILLAERLWRKNKRGQAITLMVVSNAVMGFVAFRNTTAINAVR